MKAVGFPIGNKENEYRRSLVPEDIAAIKHPEMLWFEQGYGNVLGYDDSEYAAYGCHICSHNEVFEKDIICDPKVGDADYLETINGKTVFGWVHAVQNRDITDKVLKGNNTAYAWEDMYYGGRHLFYRNNEIAGEAAIMHGFECYGDMPFGKRVALIGKGNTGSGALKILTLLGASVTIYDRHTIGLISQELERYDAVVNAILWDTSRTDHIIYKSDLKRMKKNALIIDISCDRAGAIETSVPTTIDEPVYMVDGITHYVVDHTPALFFKMASASISKVVAKYIDELIEDCTGSVMTKALIIKDGKIIDQRINDFQKR